MSDHLFKEWIDKEIPLSVSLDDSHDLAPTIDDVRERMSLSFGWESWDEMIDAISKPHTPNYIDNSTEALELVTLRLAKSIGYNYAHGMILNLI